MYNENEIVFGILNKCFLFKKLIVDLYLNPYNWHRLWENTYYR